MSEMYVRVDAGMEVGAVMPDLCDSTKSFASARVLCILPYASRVVRNQTGVAEVLP